MDSKEKPSREELLSRLKNKINREKNSRTTGISRKKGEDINNSFRKIGEILEKNNVTSTEQIDQTLIDTILSIISKKDLELVCSRLPLNNEHRNVLNEICNKM